MMPYVFEGRISEYSLTMRSKAPIARFSGR
jgi:hypothetical protein